MWEEAKAEAGSGEWVGWVFGAGVMAFVLVMMARSVKKKERKRRHR